VSSIKIDPGSFRDPSGNIFNHEDKIIRILKKEGTDRLKYFKENDLLNQSISRKFLIESNFIDAKALDLDLDNVEEIIEHKKLNYVSYPYEWSFDQLKDAALHHLEFHIFLLENEATLIDSSAYNIQFDGYKPVFIDILSIKKYQNGEYWKGHKQFCENFLYPLILKAKKNIDFNNWFRGNLEGIKSHEINSLLTLGNKFSYTIFTQVVLLNYLEKKFLGNKEINIEKIKEKNFQKKSYLGLLNQLKNFIISLKVKKNKTVWDDYSINNTYTKNEENLKITIVSEFAEKYKFDKLVDLGCNDGVYSKECLKKGCKFVVGFDYDLNVVNQAYNISKKEKLNFLPLYLDASNPSPNIGWGQIERKGFIERLNFSGMLALAFEHHLAIAKNIPLDQLVKWLLNIAPKGLIEFVPKSDQTIRKMLLLKGDIFRDYSEENFKNLILRNAKIVSEKKITESGRKIFEYSK
tara:strand:- start:56 stop:1447 length:1392 start_codon:yes stop_codon:yes gene_type:complete